MKISDHNALTNETIERDATAEELEQFEADAEFIAEIKAEAAAKKAAAETKLEALGLTADDIKALSLG